MARVAPNPSQASIASDCTLSVVAASKTPREMLSTSVVVRAKAQEAVTALLSIVDAR